MTYQINYAYTSHVGKVRANNEDNFWCCGEFLPQENQGTAGVCSGSVPGRRFPALAVFDGMGGESCGEAAAFLAARQFGDFYEENKKDLRKDPRIFWRMYVRV